jgi:hypothetical protein
VSAESEKKGDLKVGQIFRDVGTVAVVAGAIVGAGPTSGLIAVAATADQLQPNIREEVTDVLKKRSIQQYSINALSLRQNQSRTFNIVTDEKDPKPVGTVRVRTEFQPSLFWSLANTKERTAYFRDTRPDDFLEFPLEFLNNKSIATHVKERFPSIDQRLTEARIHQDKDKAWYAYRDACNSLRTYATQAQLIRRDSVILRWAFLSTLPRFTDQGFLPDECFNEQAGREVTLLSQMGFSTLPRK